MRSRSDRSCHHYVVSARTTLDGLGDSANGRVSRPKGKQLVGPELHRSAVHLTPLGGPRDDEGSPTRQRNGSGIVRTIKCDDVHVSPWPVSDKG
jgi:hypothetical protein